MRITVWPGNQDGLSELFGQHPHVTVSEPTGTSTTRFQTGDWRRRIEIDNPDLEVFGLVEWMDNNPMVCADAVGLPGPASTLVLTALLPLIRTGLLQEPPNVLLSFEADPEPITAALSQAGWESGCSYFLQEQAWSNLAATTVMALIPHENAQSNLEEAFQEAYSRSIYIRLTSDSEWSESLAEGQPSAFVQIRASDDRPLSIATIHVLADRLGKCGASQIVHAFNVMCGFEESLGID